MKRTFHLLAEKKRHFNRGLDFLESVFSGILGFVEHSSDFLTRGASFKLLAAVFDVIIPWLLEMAVECWSH